MNIPDRMSFQPSSETLKKWLATRKPSHPIGSVDFPGLFSDTGNSSDQNWFTFAIVGEILGLGASISAGITSEDTATLFFAVGVVIVFIILDIVFAVRLHRNEGNITLLRSRRLAFNEGEDSERAQIRKIENKINEGKLTNFFLKAGIILIALTKSVGIFILEALGENAPDILYFLIAIIYFIVAYIHIYHTGFYLAYTGTQGAINKEHKDFANGKFHAREKVQQFTTTSELRLPIVQGTHSIVQDGNDANYILKSRGVLTDDDIVSLVSCQPQTDANKIEIFKACRKLQVETINLQND